MPFLSSRLVEFSLGLLIGEKVSVNWSKSVLRKDVSDMRSWLSAARDLMKVEVSASVILQEITEHQSLLDNFEGLPLLEQWRYFNLGSWESV